MEGIEFGDEVIMIAATIIYSLDGTYLIIDAFASASRDEEVVPVEDPGPVFLQSVGRRQSAPRQQLRNWHWTRCEN